MRRGRGKGKKEKGRKEGSGMEERQGGREGRDSPYQC